MVGHLSKKLVAPIERDARLVDAIHHAMYALVITNGTRAIDESGEEYVLDFTPQIDRLRRALQLLGIDTNQPMPAPGRNDPVCNDIRLGRGRSNHLSFVLGI